MKIEHYAMRIFGAANAFLVGLEIVVADPARPYNVLSAAVISLFMAYVAKLYLRHLRLMPLSAVALWPLFFIARFVRDVYGALSTQPEGMALSLTVAGVSMGLTLAYGWVMDRKLMQLNPAF